MAGETFDENGNIVELGDQIEFDPETGEYRSSLLSGGDGTDSLPGAAGGQTQTQAPSPMAPRVSASFSIISLCALPEGIIGKQFSCFSTRQSKITGPS